MQTFFGVMVSWCHDGISFHANSWKWCHGVMKTTQNFTVGIDLPNYLFSNYFSQFKNISIFLAIQLKLKLTTHNTRESQHRSYSAKIQCLEISTKTKDTNKKHGERSIQCLTLGNSTRPISWSRRTTSSDDCRRDCSWRRGCSQSWHSHALQRIQNWSLATP